MTLVVGLTGNIGSGKSTICKIFQSIGVAVFNADNEAKNILNLDDTRVELNEKFCKDEIEINGVLDIGKIALFVFSDPEKLEKLNNIIHPKVYKRFQVWLSSHTKHNYVLIEAAILFESGFNKYVDLSVNVHAAKEVRLKRVENRDKADRKSVLNRMNNQYSDELKIELSTYTIYNENELVIPQVLKIHQEILRHYT
jgi:dephospho-CoA kinase